MWTQHSTAFAAIKPPPPQAMQILPAEQAGPAHPGIPGRKEVPFITSVHTQGLARTLNSSDNSQAAAEAVTEALHYNALPAEHASA
jgi:hypothetical protein